MEIYGPLQVIPPGLIGFLQLKNAGKNPTDIPSTLQPILELRDWYLQFGAEDIPVGSVAVAGGTVGGSVFTTQPLTVPDDQWWFVHEYFIRANALAVGDAVAFTPMWFSSPITNPNAQHALGTPQVLISGGAAGPRVGVATANRFFVPPGGQLGFLGQINDSAGNITYQGFARVTRLPA